MSDNEDIFSTPESEARLDLIKHLIENSELVPLVRGMSGIGKSLLASRLQTGAPDNWVVCLFEADSMMQPERLLAHVARCNGLPDAKEDNLRRLVERFELMRKRGSIPVLLIDEAQQLPPTSLITLLRLYERQVGGGPLLSLVLFADEQIDMLLSTPQLQIMSPQSIQVIDLPPLTRDEADSYMRYLLRQEGLDLSLELDAGQMNRIYRETQGAPGPLGTAIRKEVGELDDAPTGSGLKIRGPLLWAGVPLGVVLLLLLLFQGPINRLFSPEPESMQEKVVSETPQAQPATPPVAEAGALEQPPIVLPQPGREEQAPLPQVDDLASHETVAGSAAEEGQSEPELEPAPAEKSPVVAEASPQPISGRPTPEAVQASPNGTPAIERAVEPPDSTDPAVETSGPEVEQVVPAGGVKVSPVSRSSKQPLAQAEETVEAPVQPEVANAPEKSDEEAGLLRSRDWLDEQARGSYTLQLLAVGNTESVKAAITRYGLQEQAFSVKTVRQGKAWYPLLWGVYPDRGAALAAVKRLPEELQKSGAWARSLASLRP